MADAPQKRRSLAWAVRHGYAKPREEWPDEFKESTMLYDRLRNVEEAGDNILRRHEGPGSKRMEEAEERKAFMSNLARAGLRRQQEATETPRRTPQAFVRWPEEVERPKPRPDYSRRARPLRTYIDPGTGANPWIRPVPKYSGRNLENRYPKRLGPASGRR